MKERDSTKIYQPGIQLITDCAWAYRHLPDHITVELDIAPSLWRVFMRPLLQRKKLCVVAFFSCWDVILLQNLKLCSSIFTSASFINHFRVALTLIKTVFSSGTLKAHEFLTRQTSCALPLLLFGDLGNSIATSYSLHLCESAAADSSIQMS